jgi:hypothetical protein
MKPIAIMRMRQQSAAPSYAGPVFVTAGAVNAGTATAAIVWPAHLADDIGILLVKTGNQALPADPTGCTAIYTPTGTGVAAAIDSVRLHAYWIRATSSAMPDISTGDSGNHQVGAILLFRGCVASGSPIDVTATDVLGAASTGVTIPGLTTLGDNRMVVAACGIGLPDAANTTNASGWANGSLTNLTEILDRTVTTGNGGGFVAACGEAETAGAVGATTATLANSTLQERLSFALIPA